MTRYLFLALLVAAAWSCQNEENASQDASSIPSIDSLGYALLCIDLTQPEDKTPHHDVMAVAGKDTVKVGTIEICEKIDPAQYAEYEIPEDAIQAVGGKSPDNTVHAVYIGKSPEGKITARIGNMYPGKPSGSFEYRTMVVFTEEDAQVVNAINPSTLVGSYVHSGAGKSFVLYLGYSHRTVVGQAYTLDGPLPEDDAELMTAVAQAQPEIIPALDIDFSTLTFTSSKGNGSLLAEKGQVKSITFANFNGMADLTLEKKAVGQSLAQ